MEIGLSPEDLAFQEKIRTFIRDNYPSELREKLDAGEELTKEDFLSWHKILYQNGMIAPSWPNELGGTGWNAVQRFIFGEEVGAAGLIGIMPFGLTMLAPVLIQYGSEEQKSRFLPRILSGEDWWCQGYSEPGAGSDLASLNMRAVRNGDSYVLNGSKTWTSFAQFANWIFCLVRTSTEGRKQEGISFILVEMNSPGISVRPIRTMDGTYDVNEVFFEDVRVPAENLVGEENKGWTYAKALLDHERGGIAEVSRSKRWLKELKDIASQELSGGEALINNASFSRKLADLEVDLLALEYTELRSVFSEDTSGSGAEISILKIRGTEIQQKISELKLEAVGYYGFPFRFGPKSDGLHQAETIPHHAKFVGPDYFNMRKTTIYGGSSEIQKRIISRQSLGL